MKHCMIGCHSRQHFLGGVKRLSKQAFCFYYPCMWFVVHMVAQWLAVLHQGRKVPSLNQTTFMTQSLRVLHASTWVLSVYSHFLPQSKNTHRLDELAKLSWLHLLMVVCVFVLTLPVPCLWLYDSYWRLMDCDVWLRHFDPDTDTEWAVNFDYAHIKSIGLFFIESSQ